MKEKPAIAMVVDNYFEQSEMEETRSLLQEAGLRVDLISTTERNLQAVDGDVDRGDNFTADFLLSEIDAEDYDAVVLPGGVINADRLRMNEAAKKFLTEMYDSDKLIAALCHAPWVLISADLFDGHTATSYPSLQVDLKNAGVQWVDKNVVVDGNIITSRHPGDIPDFAQAIIDILAED